MISAALFAGLDRAVFAAAFADRLRTAGVACSMTAVERCATALVTVKPANLDDLYWVLRLSCVSDVVQLPAFDAVFGAVFSVEAGRLPSQRQGQPASNPDDDARLHRLRAAVDCAGDPAALPWSTLPSIAGDDGSAPNSDDHLAIPELRPSAVDEVIDRPFDALDDAELERIAHLLAATTQWPERPSRRRRVTRAGGPIALRPSIRRSLATGGDVVRLWHTQGRTRARRVVIIVDVSGSMERYARAYLHLTRQLAIHRRAEIFAFATRLTRITPAVRLRSPEAAIKAANAGVDDRFSGTRLASSLDELVRHRTWNTMVRGAVVVICSDGWDSDDPATLDRAMGRLGRLAHRIIWVNPRAAAEGFEPITAGMVTALPHCDRFLPGNTGRAMGDVIDAITAA